MSLMVKFNSERAAAAAASLGFLATARLSSCMLVLIVFICLYTLRQLSLLAPSATVFTA